ncbi:MAG: invasion associated locus B family protein [Rhodobacteraceae bacterium]|nr:invasion associated locus B family protein [Paracoccaceae bacterium]
MKRVILSLSVAALCAFAPMSQAQETPTVKPTTEDTTTQETGTQETTETTTEANTQDEAFPVAEENDEPKVGDLYVQDEHGDWEVRCIRGEGDAAEACRIYQLLLDTDGARVAEINIQPLPKGGKAVAGVDFATPLGTLLTAKVVMRVDSGKATSYQYNWCDQYGCFSRFGFTAAEIAALKKGAAATVTIRSVSLPEEPINLKVSLTGFTAAWRAVSGG